MKKKNDSCSNGCPFKIACWAGFLAVLVMTLTIGLSGVNYTKALGVMFLGYGTSTLTLYLVGFLVHLFFGLVFAFIYVFFIAGIMPGVPAWVKGLVYGLLITIGAHLTMPLMDQLAMISRGKGDCRMATCCSCTACGTCNATTDKTTDNNVCGSCKSCSSKDKYMRGRHCTRPMKHPIQASLGQHIVYGIVLAVVVAHGCCRRED